MALLEMRKSPWLLPQYHVVPGNIDQLHIFRNRVNRLCQNILFQRSQAARENWNQFTPVFDRSIQSPCVLRPCPEQRFYATHPS